VESHGNRSGRSKCASNMIGDLYRECTGTIGSRWIVNGKKVVG